MKIEVKFEPYDKVLVRDFDNKEWKCSFFSHYADKLYVCIDFAWYQCIPYKGNEHLVGTCDKPMSHEEYANTVFENHEKWEQSVFTPCTKEIKRAEYGDEYFYISPTLDIEQEHDYRTDNDNSLYLNRNYFRDIDDARDKRDEIIKIL